MGNGRLALAFLALVAAPRLARADKTDLLEMSNGDRLVCEITDLDQGRLRVKTDGLGTIYAEWDKVVGIESSRTFEVQLTSGARLYGSLGKAAALGHLIVVASTGDQEIALVQVVRLERLRSRFFDRFDGSLDLGGSYTQANQLLQLNPALSATYVERAFQAGLDLSGTWTRQEDEADASRAVGTLSYAHFQGTRWLVFGLATAERNTELGLDLRLLASAGWGRIVQATPHGRLLAGVGLSVTREKPREGSSTSNLEGLLWAEWRVFLHSFPKTRVSVAISLYPGLTDGGRVRGNLDAQVRREIIRDFTIGLTVYDSFDTRPAIEGAAQNDWGATIALGWTF